MNMRKIKVLFAAAVLVLSLGLKSEAGEIYTAEARGHYANPVNGDIEDAGNNFGIGEGMVGNSVYGLALVEKDDSGKLYATVRYRLRDQIKDVKMWVQDKGADSFTEVPVEETQNTGKTGDFRFEIPSTDALIKSSFFVNPMGRDVVFFVTIGNLQEGNTDFKAFVSSSGATGDSSGGEESSYREKNQAQDVKTPERSASKSEKNTGPKNAVLNKEKSLGSKVAENRDNPLKTDSEKKKSENSHGFSHGLLTNRDFEDNGEKNKEKRKSKPLGPITRGIILFAEIVGGIIFSIIILAAAAILILYKYIKYENNKMENTIYPQKRKEKILFREEASDV